MRYMFIFAVFLLLLAGCQTATKETASTAPAVQVSVKSGASDISSHMGCQEDEVLSDGTCSIASDNNAGLFDTDTSNVVTKDVGGKATGYLAMPSAAGDYPGVVMIHEWWGLNDNIKQMARILASKGYVVFAIDLYGGEVASDSDAARRLATSVRDDPQAAIAEMKAAVEYLENEVGVKKVASLGWCFGGQHSLLLSLNQELDATVIYYGQLVDDKEQLKSITWPVLGIFGSEDTGISVDSVESFGSALDDLGIENDIYIYEGVGHAFANPSGSNYAENETLDAWSKTLYFLDKNLKKELLTGSASASAASTSAVRTFQLTGKNYRFMRGETESPDIRVKEGDVVRIEFTSTEGFHDWVIDEFNAATEKVSAGSSSYVEFVADRKGTFEYYCSVGSHRANGMYGKLVVE